MNEIKKMIKPYKPLPEFNLPENIITVAVHVRKGGGFDAPLLSKQKSPFYADQRWPTKFPPDQYYIDQIKQLSEMLGDPPLYVHIFTDHQKPTEIVERYRKAVSKPNITYHCREEGNRHDRNILEDLFAMAKFDCLIRGSSHFSLSAQLIGNHMIVIHPKKAKWEGNKLIIEEVNTIIKCPSLLEK